MNLVQIGELLQNRLFTPKLVEVIAEKTVICSGDYEAEDVVSEITTDGSGTPWVFSGCVKRNGGAGYIVSALVTAETTNIASWLSLFLFNAYPTCEMDDDAGNTAPLLADRNIYLGRIDFPACSDLGSGMSESEASPSTVGNLPKAFVCNPGSRNLYGVMVIRNVVDLSDNTKLTVRLFIEQY